MRQQHVLVTIPAFLWASVFTILFLSSGQFPSSEHGRWGDLVKEHSHSKQSGVLLMYSFGHQEIIVEEIKQKKEKNYTLPFAF